LSLKNIEGNGSKYLSLPPHLASPQAGEEIKLRGEIILEII